MSKPGSAPEQPVWIREVPYEPTRADRIAGACSVVTKVITAAYTLAVAWQTLKILSPPLQMKEDIFLAALKRKFTRPDNGALPELPAEVRAELYDDLRRQT